MNSRQEILRDKLFAGRDLLREITSLKIAAEINSEEIRKTITMQNEELSREYEKLIDIRSKIDRCICTITEKDLRALLIMKYLGHNNVNELSEKLSWSTRTIERKHVEALNRILSTGADRYLDY